MLKKILLGILLLLVLLAAGLGIWLYSLKPDYSGDLNLKGIKEEVQVFYDDFGVPHIYAKNEEDAYCALGYVVAQDRLFQIEMIRRLASGRLSEVLGNSLVRTDRFFRTLGINRHAKWSAEEFQKRAPEAVKKSTQAYINGINQYIENGSTPIEFRILGIEKEAYTLQDVFLITGYMAFGFAEGFRIDPMVEGMYRKAGEIFMKDLELGWPKESLTIPVHPRVMANAEQLSQNIDHILETYPVSPWIGSNSWVLAPKKTKNGKTLLCNDTHMGYAQPSIWYEAHLEYPGFHFYGNHLSGFPFALTGHSDFCGNGLTMFENDDVDFYIEQRDGNNVLFNKVPTPLKMYTEVIHVKDSSDVNLQVAESTHGPLMEQVIDNFPIYNQAVSVWWSYLKYPSRSLDAVYALNHARSLDDARNAVAQIDAPGLNVMYGDKDGHIAWWAAAKLVQRRPGLFSKRFLDGASGADEPLGWLDFSQNPQSEDPEVGYVYSANNQPDSIVGGLYPGYYVPEFRARRIVNTLSAKDGWDIEMMRKLMTDGTSDAYPAIAKELLRILETVEPVAVRSEEANRLASWEGGHGLEASGVLIYYRWIYNILRLAMRDKIGPGLFNAYMNSHLMKTSYPELLKKPESVWWDIWTTKAVEKRHHVIQQAWHKTIDELIETYGKDRSKWKWSIAHTIEHVHPIGRKKPFNMLFNVGPASVSGGNEVINNIGFKIDSTGYYPATFGPAMRRIIDFKDVDHSWSILPTGQSGYFMADHYDDQFDLYNKNGFRPQLMDRAEIEKQADGKFLKLSPAQ
ncbi:MAG TPA: penicillin acylase family protein [Flavobacteriales bacterium]|nr:penicillin acylase family protein [Flavobacteriales bacterium]